MPTSDFLKNLNQNFPIVKDDGTPTDYFMRLLRDNDAELGGALDNDITADTGLSGGGNLGDGPITLSLAAALDMLNDVDLTVPPTDGQVLKYVGADNQWKAGSDNSGGAGEVAMVFKNTGQDFAANTWTNTTLDGFVHNGITGASITTGILTLPAGTYLVEGNAQSIRSNEARLRLRNNTAATTLCSGQTVWSGNATGTGVGAWGYPTLFGKFTLAAATPVQVQQFIASSTTSFTDNGLLLDIGTLGFVGNVQEFKFTKLS
jgi:hypothetical protein